MAQLRKIKPDWAGEPCIVAAPGPSLTREVAQRVRMARLLDGWRVVAVQDAYRLALYADAIFGGDLLWWRVHGRCSNDWAELWSTHDPDPLSAHINNKTEAAEKWGVNLVRGLEAPGFSFNQTAIHYGSNTGFQGINLALLKGCRRIVLVGFDMRRVDGRSHFFGEHPDCLPKPNRYEQFLPAFEVAARLLPADVSIVNATPGSALRCFGMSTLEDALDHRGNAPRPDGRVHRDGAVADARAD